ncbi:MAG: CDP-alcohol phosphatidyltransferase family protein [Candidatus Kapaibacterium sp.]
MRLPTQLTVLRIALVPVFFVLVAMVRPPEIGWAVVVLAIAAASDWWVCYKARAMGLVSPLGAFLDPLADKLLTSAAFVAFAWSGYIPWWMVAIVLARDIFLTLLRPFADSVGLPIKTSYFAKVKTFAQMTFILLVLAALLGQDMNASSIWGGLGREFFEIGAPLWLMGLVTLLTFVSAVLYGYDNWPALRETRALFRRATDDRSSVEHESV